MIAPFYGASNYYQFRLMHLSFVNSNTHKLKHKFQWCLLSIKIFDVILWITKKNLMKINRLVRTWCTWCKFQMWYKDRKLPLLYVHNTTAIYQRFSYYFPTRRLFCYCMQRKKKYYIKDIKCLSKIYGSILLISWEKSTDSKCRDYFVIKQYHVYLIKFMHYNVLFCS